MYSANYLEPGAIAWRQAFARHLTTHKCKGCGTQVCSGHAQLSLDDSLDFNCNYNPECPFAAQYKDGIYCNYCR